MNRKARRMNQALKRGKKTLYGYIPGQEPAVKRFRVQTTPALQPLAAAAHQIQQKERHNG